MSLGFQKAGFKIVAAYENWDSALDTYRENFEHPAIKQDLSNVNDAVNHIKAYEPDVIIGGPPCQDFSTAGHQDETRGRAALSIHFSEIISRIQPQYFVMENVATIKSSKSFAKALQTFSEAGYGITCSVLNAAYCGVPQTRKRMFVIGSLGDTNHGLTSYLEKNQTTKPMSIYDYLGDSLGIEHYFRVPTNYSRRGVFSIYEPSMTIRAVDRPVPSGYKGHPNDSAPVNEVRNLTPNERGMIQTFPRDFKFIGSKTTINQMIGNAVPVNLAKHVAESLLNYIQDNKG